MEALRLKKLRNIIMAIMTRKIMSMMDRTPAVDSSATYNKVGEYPEASSSSKAI